MNLKLLASSLLLLLATALVAQDSTGLPKKSLQALRITTPIHIDGLLNEPEWQHAPVAGDFIELEPNPGQPAHQTTEVKVLYDDAAIYVGAVMHDTSGKKISTYLSDRDNINSNSDWFGFFIDCYRDGLNGVGMFITAAGVQNDAKYSVFGEDFSWDAVWDCHVTIDTDKWTAEFRIPYSALRFSAGEEQTWGINFGRFISHSKEKAFWNTIDPEVNGFLNQAGILTGIKNIEPPVRLALYPYISSYYENYHDKNNPPSENRYGFSGGLDLKYGINDAFTLDMTLVPDFAQVQTDAQVLNLSPFEVRFDEKRQFFTEGTELFNKGDLFYSRRVGGTPLLYYDVYDMADSNETVTDNPYQAQLINATKFSGRTGGNLGIGVFNAVSATTYATIKNTSENTEREVLTNPLTNYNVLVLDQGLKNSSYLTLINTNVMRDGSFYDADVTGTELTINNKKQSYGVFATGAVSQKYFTGFDNPETGYTSRVSLKKISGNFTAEAWQYIESDKYDPNDLGFLSNNNTWGEGVNAGYNIYKPFGKFLQMSFNFSSSYLRLYNPDKFHNLSFDLQWWGRFKNYVDCGGFFTTEPVITYDYWEPRIWGRYYSYPVNHNIGAWMSTDYTKKFAVDLSTNFRKFIENGRYRWNVSVYPRWRVSDHFNLVYGFSSNRWINDVGYADDDGTNVLFGIRDNITYENILEGNYVFNNQMGISLNGRHYWSFAKYHSVYELSDDGLLTTTAWSQQYSASDYDVNYNAFTIDMIYRWRFAPGSEMDVVWKNAIYQFATGSGTVEDNYIDDFGVTFDTPQTNNISVKIIYYIDYLMAKNWLKKKK